MCSAITRGDIITLRNLLRCNSDPNSLDYDKRAPLHIAAAEGNLQAVSHMGLSELGLEPSSSSNTQTVNSLGLGLRFGTQTANPNPNPSSSKTQTQTVKLERLHSVAADGNLQALKGGHFSL
jgi:ankyrin repeat protein